jgi:hypothetical protein
MQYRERESEYTNRDSKRKYRKKKHPIEDYEKSRHVVNSIKKNLLKDKRDKYKRYDEDF